MREGRGCGWGGGRWGAPLGLATACPRSRADMRKAMPRDREKRSVVPRKKAVYPHELEFD